MICFAMLLASVTRSYGQASVVLEEWPFTTNANDSAAVRATGVVGTIPTLNHLYLSNNLNNGSGSQLLPYSPTNGQATSASNVTPGDGKWATTAGGPGGNGNRNMYEQFQMIPATGNSLRVDSFIASSAFASSASGASFMVVYSLSNFVSDSTPIPGYTFGLSTGQVVLTQLNAAPFPVYSLLLFTGGVTVPAGDTLTIRVYPTCSSSSAGRYWEIMNVIVKGAVTSSGGCLTQPGAIVSSLPSICAGQSGAIYSVPAVTGATSYTWTYSGTGATFTPTSARDSVTINFSTAATSGTLSVTANAGCGSSTAQTKAITVNALPANTVTTNTGGTSVCSGGSITLVGLTAMGYTYQWLLNNGLVTGATNATYTTGATGSYRVRVTDANGCSDTSTATVITSGTVPTLPVISPATAQSFCPGGHAVLSITKLAGNTYQWLKNSAAVGDTLATDTVTAAGIYTVKATSGSGCSDTSAGVTVTVNTLPGDTVTASGTLSLCTGGSVVLTSTVVSGGSYQWLNNGAAISGAITNTYTATAAGSYSVKVTGSNTCTDTSTAKVVTVNAYPADTVSASGALTFCAGGSVTLTVNSTTGATYQWLKNGTAISGAISNTYIANTSGTYTVNVANNGCGDTSAVKTVIVNPLPIPVVTETNRVLSTGVFVTYQWNLNGSAVSNATSSTFTVVTNGIYTVTVTDGNGCSNTSAPDTVVDVAVPAIQSLGAQIKLYPNPTTDVVYINAPVKVNIAIAGMDGRLLLRKEEATALSIANLANGIYMIMVYDEHNVLMRTDKLVKN